MARITLTEDTLKLALTNAEKVAGLHGDIEVPISAVRDVAVVEKDAPRAVRGIRSPGLAWFNAKKIGTWRRRGHRSFVVTRRGVPAVRIELSGVKPDELVVSTPDAERVAAELRGRLGAA